MKAVDFEIATDAINRNLLNENATSDMQYELSGAQTDGLLLEAGAEDILDEFR